MQGRGLLEPIGCLAGMRPTAHCVPFDPLTHADPPPPTLLQCLDLQLCSFCSAKQTCGTHEELW